MNILPIGIQTANTAKYNKTSFNGGTAKIAQKQLISNPDLSERMVTALQTDIKNRLGVKIPREYFEFHWMPIQTNKIKSIKSCNISSSILYRNFYDDKDNFVGACEYISRDYHRDNPDDKSPYMNLNSVTNYYIAPDGREVTIIKKYADIESDGLTDITVALSGMPPSSFINYVVDTSDKVNYCQWNKFGGPLGLGQFELTPLT